MSTRSKLWVAADSGRLARAQTWIQFGDNRLQLQADYQTIEYNVEIPPDTFAIEPPEGYTATNSKETAPAMAIGASTARCGANGYNLECSVAASFTLADGSVVVGWQGVDVGSEQSQAPLFENLTFGGSLPKLPIEIYGLRPAGMSSAVTYTGHHLGCTRKADRFTEWTLYVPSGTAPASARESGYDVLYRFNLDPQPSAGFGLRVGYGVPINTAEDFDAWVRGAMAELSDGGVAPETITYQKVVDLARRLRTPG
jgi:hypothetical protein